MRSVQWVLTEGDEQAATAIAEGTGVSLLTARLLVNRGILDPAAARSFLACDRSMLSDPSAFAGMDRAADRIRRAIRTGERITVYGDYDVDGVTGTALLYLALRNLGANIETYLPDRMTEGYGLNGAALAGLRQRGTGLVITVDCGITAGREAAIARSLGLDLIITDHHAFAIPPNAADAPLPEAVAVLHPAVTAPDVPPATREAIAGLTGVGVAFKLAQALSYDGKDGADLFSFLDLVTLGTIADVGRLSGENRILVKEGLQMLSAGDGRIRPGLAALKQVTGLTGKTIGVGAVGFSLAPRINASGRMERADAALQLLTTDAPDEALRLATGLDEVNRERQAVEQEIWQHARRLCSREQDPDSIGAYVLASPDWHPGVVGIVASRIVEEFHRPAALISIHNGVGKGSARSTLPGFDLAEGLAACADLLLGYGGHTYAAGFSIAAENIPRFRERLSAIVLDRVGPEGFIRTLRIDGAVALRDLTPGLLEEIDRLAPFGQGNPEPRLGARGLSVLSARIVGNNHLKFRVRQGDDSVLDAIAFNRGSLLGRSVREGARIAAVFTPRLNTWNNRTTVELDIRDVKIDKDTPK